MSRIKITYFIFFLLVLAGATFLFIQNFNSYEAKIKARVIEDANLYNKATVNEFIIPRYKKFLQGFYANNNKANINTFVADVEGVRKSLNFSKIIFFSEDLLDVNRLNNKRLDEYLLLQNGLANLQSNGFVSFSSDYGHFLGVTTVINIQPKIGSYKPLYVLLEKEMNNYFIDKFSLYTQIITIIIIVAVILLFLLQLAVKKANDLASNQIEENINLTTAKKEAEEENSAKSRFLANISHELRTPLNSIIGFSEIIKNDTKGQVSEEYKKHASDINLAGIHLLGLINDILDFSKANEGKLEVELADLDLTKLIANCVRLLKPRADEGSLEIIAEAPKEHVVVCADERRLKQVLLNIITNSIKNTDKGGKITIFTYRNISDKKVVIEIVDNGVGIAKKDLAKVLSSFGQITNKVNKKHEGTGLGLPLSKLLVELMKGEFIIESELGKGTMVKIIIPESKGEFNI